MKILVVTTISNTINAFLIPHIKFLKREGHEVHIACKIVQPFKNELIETAVNFHEISFDRTPLSLKNYQSYNKLKKILQTEKFDIIHTHTPNASLLVRLASRKMKTKVMYTAHGFHFFEGASKKNWWVYHNAEKFAIKYTDILVTINEEDYVNAKKMSKNSKCKVFKIDGIGVDFSYNKLTNDEKKKLIESIQCKNKKIVTYVASLDDRKNQSEAINLISRVNNDEDVKLLLIGDGEKRKEYEKLVEINGLSDVVFFLGYQTNIHDYLQITDLLISTSKQEGLPVNIMEGMSHALPILASNIRGHKDLLQEYPFGELYDDFEDLYKKTLKLLNSTCYATSFSMDKYGINQSVNQMEKIYDYLIQDIKGR